MNRRPRPHIHLAALSAGSDAVFALELADQRRDRLLGPYSRPEQNIAPARALLSAVAATKQQRGKFLQRPIDEGLLLNAEHENLPRT